MILVLFENFHMIFVWNFPNLKIYFIILQDSKDFHITRRADHYDQRREHEGGHRLGGLHPDQVHIHGDHSRQLRVLRADSDPQHQRQEQVQGEQQEAEHHLQG